MDSESRRGGLGMDGPTWWDTSGRRLPDAVTIGVYSSSVSEELDSSLEESEALTTGGSVSGNTVTQGSGEGGSNIKGEVGEIISPGIDSERSVEGWSAKIIKELAEGLTGLGGIDGFVRLRVHGPDVADSVATLLGLAAFFLRRFALFMWDGLFSH